MHGRWLSARYIVLFLISVFLLSSCSNIKHLGEGEYILKSNAVKVESSSGLKKIRKNIEQNISIEGKLASLAKQQPSTRTLGIGMNLRMYNFFYTTKDSGLWHFMQSHLGTPPVIFDSLTLPSSTRLMHDYLVSKGYLFPSVAYNFKISKRKKAKVQYTVQTGPLYTIDSVFFPVDTGIVYNAVARTQAATLLHSTDAFDADELAKEQVRIQHEFQNNGYYYFKRDIIYFQADTSIGNHRVNIYIRALANDTSFDQKQYSVRNIYLFPDFHPEYDIDSVKYDTIQYGGYTFFTTEHYVDPDILSAAVFMVKGALFSRSSYECTMNRLYDLAIFKFANAKFVNVKDSVLDCYIYLTPTKKHQVGFEVSVGNVESNFASGLKISFGSKNVAHRANRIDLSLNGGIQVPVFPTLRYDSIFYNFGAQLNYSLPRFAIPFINTHISCYNNPLTRISLKANYFQQTNYYSLQSYGLTYSLEWKDVDFPMKKYIFPILGINYVFPTYSTSFAERLATDPFLAESFSKQFIQSIGGAYIYSNQRLDRRSNFTYLSVNFETAGNLLYALSNTVINLPRDSSGAYQVFGIEFANYVRSEVDVRQYLQFTQNRSLVLRFSPGIIVPYGNSKVNPYVKQFYLGGTNSMRAWRVRSLGPGSYIDTSYYYNSAGDFKLEANVEYRFNIFARLKGAAFMDAGNIWLLGNDVQKEGGTFYFDNFFEQIALGGGLGLRLDFSYFVLRLDAATKMYDPTLAAGERWVIKDVQFFSNGKLLSNSLLQFAVNYPF